MSEEHTPTPSPTMTAQLKEGSPEQRLHFFEEIFRHANAWNIYTKGTASEETTDIINAQTFVRDSLLSGHVGLCPKCDEPTNELFTDEDGVCVWCIREGQEAEQVNRENHNTTNEEHTENGGFLCVCADCGEVVPEWEEDPHHNDLKDCPHPLGLWADCPDCGITGVEFDSHDLPEFVGGQGTNYDFQFHLRHFGEHHTPDLEAVVACLREERETPFNGCPTCQELRGPECRINSLDEMAHPDIKTQCVECVEIEMDDDGCECITTDMSGNCLHCGRTPAEQAERDGRALEYDDCPDCGGTGYAETERAPCPTCGGDGHTNPTNNTPTGEVVE